MTNGIETLIVIPAALQRAGLKALLQGHGFNVVGEAATVATALAQLEAGLAPTLVLVECPDLDSDEFEHLKAMKSVAAATNIVVLVDGLPANIAQLLCDAGVAGLLKTDIAPEALIGYINLVMLGETVVHQAVGRLSDSGAYGGSFGTVPKEFANLSQRELTVISHLATGRSNKEIARHLGITDGTIKIHVRNVQRKLQLKNRTQIAVWAVENGLLHADAEAA
ncbi:MAG: LuxR C-terminal-related transcriptional regulator [Alphaproteobacteria bacterium]